MSRRSRAARQYRRNLSAVPHKQRCLLQVLPTARRGDWRLSGYLAILRGGG